MKKVARLLQRNPAAEVDAWNGQYPVGIPVTVTLDDGAQRETRTRSEAWVLGGHTAVILVEGISGCYLLERVKP